MVVDGSETANVDREEWLNRMKEKKGGSFCSSKLYIGNMVLLSSERVQVESSYSPKSSIHVYVLFMVDQHRGQQSLPAKSQEQRRHQKGTVVNIEV